MKKTKKIVLLMIMIALIVLPLASASAQCSHDPYYWNEDFVYFYEYGDELTCIKTTVCEYECRICGELWSKEISVDQINHDWCLTECLGPVPGEPTYYYLYTCSQCGHTTIAIEFPH